MTSDYERIRQENVREYGQGTRHLDFLQRLYADRTHFIFELLQNAEDAGATQVTFVLDNRQLLIHHDGRPFNERDVRGVCGVSESTKDDELTGIGKFGIGFKSVYAYTTLPEVHSGDEHFRIRHYVRPEPAPWRGRPLNGRTVFVFPFDRDDVSPSVAHAEISAGLSNLDPTALLFLRHIHIVTVQSDALTVRLTRVRDDMDQSKVELIRRVGDRIVLHDYWWAFQRPLDHLGHDGRRVEIAFKRLGPSLDAPVERLRSSPLVAYFPTAKETRLGFLLQAPFRTTPARDNVPEHDHDNIILAHEASKLLVAALHELRDRGRLGIDVLEALPIDPEAFAKGGMLRQVFDAVRDALRSQPLIPTGDDTGHAPAGHVALPRGSGIRELIDATQLGQLMHRSQRVRWVPAQLTRDRTRLLWDYLRQEIGVEEITPEWIVNHLDHDFLHAADDSWVIRLYTFLDNNPALWRAARGDWERSGRARSLPLIRLEEGTHVTPFGADGRPNAYLPGPTDSDYPTVRRAISADRTARSFLTALGLQEPDAVDELLEKVLPRYQAQAVVVDEAQYERDLHIIDRALRLASGQRRVDLVKRLQATKFLLARTADGTKTGYRTPIECYWPDDELEHYFHPWPEAWFLDKRYEPHRPTLADLGVTDQVRIEIRRSNASGHVMLRDQRGDHSRGLNGFDPDLCIAGLGAALANPDLRRSTFVWNRLLVPLATRLRGVVEYSGRAEFVDAKRVDQDTEPHRLATAHAWLPGPDGRWARPAEIGLDGLPREFLANHQLADSLGMITSAIQQASTQLGVSVDLLRYLADNPDTLAELERKAQVTRQTTGAPSADHGSAALDFSSKLQEAFTKAGTAEDSSDHDDDRSPRAGRVTVPAVRRERTAAEISEAQAAEPPAHERFHVLPRKVWDGKDPAVRQFLFEQYTGLCQICSATFPKRDGSPYFELVHMISHTAAAWIDRPGNAICLCPTCAAKFIHGQAEASDILTQISSWRPIAEGGDSAALSLTLCGQPLYIKYTEKHLFDLQMMVTDAIAGWQTADLPSSPTPAPPTKSNQRF